MHNRWLTQVAALTRPLLAILLGLLVGAVAMQLTGHDVLAAYAELWHGAFGNKANLGATLARSGVIAMCAMGVLVAFRAGALNLGAEGQLVFGGLAAALVALYLPLPGVLLLPAALVAAAAAGALWAAIPAWLEARLKISVLISTLLLNYIAVLSVSYLVSQPLRDRSGEAALAQTPVIPAAAWIHPFFPGSRLHPGLFLVVAVAILLWWVLMCTVRGYEWRMTGLNPGFAEYGGVNRVRVLFSAMLASGAVVGLGGGIEVLAIQHRFIDGALTQPMFAWTGLMAALLANNHPLGALPASLLLAALQVGAMGMERNTDIPGELSGIIQAVIVLLVSVQIGFTWWQQRKARRAAHG
jgi:ABC-type uncharacterized transport system permease subunit